MFLLFPRAFDIIELRYLSLKKYFFTLFFIFYFFEGQKQYKF